MKILVTGGTAKVGTEVVQALLRHGASVRVLTRNKEPKLPDGAEVAIGDLLDPDSVPGRSAFYWQVCRCCRVEQMTSG